MITKEQYINLRNSKTVDVIYYYYREHHVPEKHIGPFDIQEFFIYLNMWGNMQQIFQKVIDYYDQKFNLVQLLDKNGNIIKYL